MTSPAESENLLDIQSAVHLIADPIGPSAAHDLLQKHRLTRPPTKDEIFEEIEKELLLPPSRLPEHWLPTYQM